MFAVVTKKDDRYYFEDSEKMEPVLKDGDSFVNEMLLSRGRDYDFVVTDAFLIDRMRNRYPEIKWVSAREAFWAPAFLWKELFGYDPSECESAVRGSEKFRKELDETKAKPYAEGDESVSEWTAATVGSLASAGKRVPLRYEPASGNVRSRVGGVYPIGRGKIIRFGKRKSSRPSVLSPKETRIALFSAGRMKTVYFLSAHPPFTNERLGKFFPDSLPLAVPGFVLYALFRNDATRLSVYDVAVRFPVSMRIEVPEAAYVYAPLSPYASLFFRWKAWLAMMEEGDAVFVSPADGYRILASANRFSENDKNLSAI